MEFDGQALRKARLEYSDTTPLSIEKLARMADVSSDTIWRAEHGVNIPSAENLARIARALGVSLDSLFVVVDPA